jgi:hypothetical protein
MSADNFFGPGGGFFGIDYSGNWKICFQGLFYGFNSFNKDFFVMRTFGAVVFKGFNNLKLGILCAD